MPIVTRGIARRRHADVAGLPEWIKPQLTELVDAAPDGRTGLAARNQVRRLPHACAPRSRRGVAPHPHRADWTHKYPAIEAAVSSLGARQAYLDGELCGVFPDGIR